MFEFKDLFLAEAALAFAYLAAVVPLAFGVVPVTPAKLKIARNGLVGMCAIFAGVVIVWGVTTDVHAVSRAVVVGILCALAGIGAVEAIRFITQEQFVKKDEVKPESVQRRGPTLEADTGGKIDATGAIIPGDLPFQFGKASTGGIIDMPEPTNAQKLAAVDRMLDDAGQRLYTLEAENERLRGKITEAVRLLRDGAPQMALQTLED